MRRPPLSGPQVLALSHSGRNEYEVIGLAWLSPLFRTRAEAEKHLRDALARLPDARRPCTRLCMTCGFAFQSEGLHNRLCGTCRNTSLAVTSAGGIASAAGRKVQFQAGQRF